MSDDPVPVDLAARLDRLDAYAQIRQLPSRYAAALAALDLDAMVALYVPDVRAGRDTYGREALKASFESSMYLDQPGKAVRITILHVGNHVIDLDGPDHATGRVYCHGEMQRGDGTWFHQAIHYGDTYARVGGEWLFVRRKHELFYGVPLGERPNGQPPAAWPADDVGTGTLPWRLDSWQAYWGDEQPEP